jgi:hypothetical protein
MSRYLSLTDLFLVGLALDVVGAVILAKALLLKPDTIFRMSTNYPGTNAYLAEDRAKQRVAAEFGLGYLGIGFLLQVLGYSAELAGISNATGSTRLFVALALAAIGAGMASVTWTKKNRWRTNFFANKVLQLQHAEEKREWEALNDERRERGEPKKPMPSWLKDVPDSLWSKEGEE